MAIAYDNSTNRAQVNSSSLTYSHTVGVGDDRILFVSVLSYLTDNITGVTYGGTSMTQVGKVRSGSSGRWIYLYMLVAPATGANNVVISASGTTYISSQASSYTGASQTSQPNVSTTNSNASTNSLTTSVTTTEDNCWLVMAGVGYGDELKAGTGTTERQGDVSGSSIFDSNGAKSPAGSYSLVAESNNNSNIQIGVVLAGFYPSGAPSPLFIPPVMWWS